FGGDLGEALAASLCPANLNRDVATFHPTEFAQTLHECGEPLALDRGRRGTQESDGRQLAGLLRAHRDRPPNRRAAEQRDELATPRHSITSSARASSIGEISMPSVLAVLTLMTNSSLVGNSMGKSATEVPLSMLCT